MSKSIKVWSTGHAWLAVRRLCSAWPSEPYLDYCKSFWWKQIWADFWPQISIHEYYREAKWGRPSHKHSTNLWSRGSMDRGHLLQIHFIIHQCTILILRCMLEESITLLNHGYFRVLRALPKHFFSSPQSVGLQNWIIMLNYNWGLKWHVNARFAKSWLRSQPACKKVC